MLREHPLVKLIVIFSAYFLLSLSLSLVFFASDALLLTKAGTSFLFYVYFGGSVVSLILSFVFYFFKQQNSSSPKIDSHFLALSIWMFGAWFLLTLPQVNPNFYVVFNGFFYGISLLANLRFWISASECFSSFEVQRHYPQLIAMGLLGDMIAGAIASYSTTYFQPTAYVFFCAGVLLLIPFLLAFVPKRNNVSTFEGEGVKTETKLLHQSSKLLPLALGIAGFGFFYSFSLYSVDYLFNVEILKQFLHEEAIIAYLGNLSFWASLGVLFYQLFLLTPVGRRFSAGKTIYFISLLLFISFTWIHFSPSLWSITLTQALLHYFVEYGTANFIHPILNTISASKKKKFKLFTEAIAQPLGTLLLLFLAFLFSFQIPISLLTKILFFSSLCFLIYPFWFQRAYRKYLVECLKSGDTLLVVNAIQSLGGKHNAAAVPELLNLLHHTQEVNLQKNLVLSLGQIQSKTAFREIFSLFSTRQESLQLAVVESLGNYDSYEGMFALLRLLKSKESVTLQVRMNATQVLTRLIGKKMIPFLMDALEEHQDLRLRANAIESIGLLHDSKTISILLPYLSSEHNRLKANAVIALYPFRSVRKAALQALDELYQSSEKNAQLSALYASAILKLSTYRKIMFDHLSSSDPSYRLMACLGLAKLEDKRFCEVYIQLLLSEDEKYAQECIRRMADFPRYSRHLVFEAYLVMDEKQRMLFKTRLDQSPLDFSNEWWMTQNKMRLWRLGAKSVY